VTQDSTKISLLSPLFSIPPYLPLLHKSHSKTEGTENFALKNVVTSEANLNPLRYKDWRREAYSPCLRCLNFCLPFFPALVLWVLQQKQEVCEFLSRHKGLTGRSAEEWSPESTRSSHFIKDGKSIVWKEPGNKETLAVYSATKFHATHNKVHVSKL
jgi:hypothetical protein